MILVRCPSCKKEVEVKMKVAPVGKYGAKLKIECPKCGHDFLQIHGRKGGGQ